MNMHSLNVVAPWSESLAAIARNIGAANGTAVDTNFANGVRANYSVGDVNTTGTIAIKIQDSADNSSWADVTGATTGVLSAAGSGSIQLYKQTRRYVRAVATVAVTNGVVASVGIEVFDSKETPNPL